MGELFRSQSMSYGQLMIPKQMVFETIEKIGELGIVQFIDLNQQEMSFKRMFSKEIHVSNVLTDFLSLNIKTCSFLVSKLMSLTAIQ